MKVQREVHVDAPPQTIYEVIMDARRLGDWVTIHQGLEQAPSGALRKGSTLTQRLKLAGRSFKVRWKVVQNDRAERVVWEGEGPMRSRAKVIYDLTADGEGTRFSYANEYHLPGGALGKMAGPVVKRVTGGELDRSLEALKRLVE